MDFIELSPLARDEADKRQIGGFRWLEKWAGMAEKNDNFGAKS